jgi:hypothetical protein
VRAERLNEALSSAFGGVAVYAGETAQSPHRLHFFELSIRGQNTKGDQQALHGELVIVREQLNAPVGSGDRFVVVQPIA